MRAAEGALASLEEVEPTPSVDAAEIAGLIRLGREVRHLVQERIAELRSQVWWQ